MNAVIAHDVTQQCSCHCAKVNSLMGFAALYLSYEKLRSRSGRELRCIQSLSSLTASVPLVRGGTR